MLSTEEMEELGVSAQKGFAVQDWSTSQEHWKFTVVEHTYYVGENGLVVPPPWSIFAAGMEVSFETLEYIIYPDIETAKCAAETVAESNGRTCDVDDIVDRGVDVGDIID